VRIKTPTCVQTKGDGGARKEIKKGNRVRNYLLAEGGQRGARGNAVPAGQWRGEREGITRSARGPLFGGVGRKAHEKGKRVQECRRGPWGVGEM